MGNAATTIQGSHEPKGLGTKLAPLLSGGFFRPLPALEPYLWSFRQLVTRGAGHGQPYDGELLLTEHCDRLGECAEPVRHLFTAGQRLALEHVGWEFLQSQTR